MGLAFGFVLYMHGYENGGNLAVFSFVGLLTTVSAWFRDIIREATFEGKHTSFVRRGLRIGFSLFIFTEIMFFVGFFWVFLANALTPSVAAGSVWPPSGIETIKFWGIPFLNTVLLLSSGVSVTWSHYSLLVGHRTDVTKGLWLTIFLASLFTALQIVEYIEAPFEISDGIYSSVFYMLTGSHGLHVFIGTVFLFVCLVRHIKHHFTKKYHVGFECAIWYWHFVDVVWLFLFALVYWWGGA